jgi:dTDP-4-dehydrorhamnose reductase
MKILITGAHSFLAFSLVSQLLSQHDVVLTSHTSGIRKIKGIGGSIYPCDLTNIYNVTNFVKKHRPDWIINCAAISMPDWAEDHVIETRTVNVLSVHNLIEACKNLQIPLLQMSTDYVFDGTHSPYFENSPRKAVNIYGQSKIEAEQLLEQSSIEYLICRTTVLYGFTEPHHRPNPFTEWYPQLLAKTPIQAATQQVTNPTYVVDLAKVLQKLIEENKRGIYHTAGKMSLSRYDFAIILAKSLGCDPNLVQVVPTIPKRAIRPTNTTLDVQKLKNETGLEIRSPSEVFKELVPRIQTFS